MGSAIIDLQSDERQQETDVAAGDSKSPVPATTFEHLLINNSSTDTCEMSVGLSQSSELTDRPTDTKRSHTEILNAIPSYVMRNDTPGPSLIRDIDKNLDGAPLERYTERIEKRWNEVDTLGKLAHLASDVGRAYRLEKQRQIASEQQQAHDDAESLRKAQQFEQELAAEEARDKWARMVLNDMPAEEKALRRQNKLRDPHHANRLASLPKDLQLTEIDLLIIHDLHSKLDDTS